MVSEVRRETEKNKNLFVFCQSNHLPNVPDVIFSIELPRLLQIHMNELLR